MRLGSCVRGVHVGHSTSVQVGSLKPSYYKVCDLDLELETVTAIKTTFYEVWTESGKQVDLIAKMDGTPGANIRVPARSSWEPAPAVTWRMDPAPRRTFDSAPESAWKQPAAAAPAAAAPEEGWTVVVRRSRK